MNTDTKYAPRMDRNMIARTPRRSRRPNAAVPMLFAAATLGVAATAGPAALAQEPTTQQTQGEWLFLEGENPFHFEVGQTAAAGGNTVSGALSVQSARGQGGTAAAVAPRAAGPAVYTSNFYGQDRDEVAYYKERIATLEKYLADARKKRGEAKEEKEKARLDEYVTRSERDLERSKEQLKEAEKRAPLFKLVDVKFTDATVEQAARALADASGVSIEVEDSIPETTRLSVEARRVKLATVLESMAEQANIIIEPNERGGRLGVRLVSPPMLRVNEKATRFVRPGSPWSSKWGMPPTRYYYSLGSLVAAVNGSNYVSAIPPTPPIPPIAFNAADIDRTVREALEKAARAQALAPGAAANRATSVIRSADGKSLSISVSNDTVIVTEAGKNDKGEAGVWMTVYKYDKDKKEMVKSSSTFHKSAAKE